MKIGVPYDSGEVFGHFGHSRMFKLYDVSDGAVVSTETVEVEGEGHCSGISALLARCGVDTLICGGIGAGAIMHMSDIGVTVYAGVSGSADGAVAALLSGKLKKSTQPNCEHDHTGHSCHGGSDQ